MSTGRNSSSNLDVANKRVIVRVDFNVAPRDGKVASLSAH
jgi:3-phosphoglycerate kinase